MENDVKIDLSIPDGTTKSIAFGIAVELNPPLTSPNPVIIIV
jgi:hypothetical protein